MTFVIGDIHGEVTKLNQLLLNIKQIDNNPELIFLGDYINKGENSKEVLELVSKMSNSIFLMGNHEYYLIEYIKNKKSKNKILKYSEKNTLEDFNITIDSIKEEIYDKYKSFFTNLKTYHETEKYFISHAGIDSKYINNDLNNIPKEMFILNNRYDFIKSRMKIKDKKFIFGHTAFSHPYVDDFKIGIDTSAVYSKENPLTSFCLEKDFFLNNLNEKKYLIHCKKNICPIIIRKKPYRMEKI